MASAQAHTSAGVPGRILAQSRFRGHAGQPKSGAAPLFFTFAAAWVLRRPAVLLCRGARLCRLRSGARMRAERPDPLSAQVPACALGSVPKFSDKTDTCLALPWSCGNLPLQGSTAPLALSPDAASGCLCSPSGPVERIVKVAVGLHTCAEVLLRARRPGTLTRPSRKTSTLCGRLCFAVVRSC